MKIDKNSIGPVSLVEPRNRPKNAKDPGHTAQKVSDGVDISSRHRLQRLLKEMPDTDESQILGEVAKSMDDGKYLPSADDVAEAILDDMSLLGEIFRWSDPSEN